MRKFRRIKYGLPVLGVAVLAAALVTGVSSYKSVAVTVDGHTFYRSTFASETVGEFLSQNGIQTTGYDLVEPDKGTQLENHIRINITTARTVWVVNGAKAPREVHTVDRTVGGLLGVLGIRLRAHDSVNHPLPEKIKSGMHIVVRRVQIKTSAQTELIPYSTEYVSSSAFLSGVRVVARRGQNGEVRVVTREEFVNGKLIKKAATHQVVRQPVSKIVDVGTAQPQPPVLASRSNSSLVANEVLTVVATAYSSPGGRTATGAPAEYGDVAVDPSVIPLGTKLYIPGYGYGIANDTGGAIQGYRIDLYFNSVQQAIDFGRRVVKVYIL